MLFCGKKFLADLSGRKKELFKRGKYMVLAPYIMYCITE
jgi:hypothetical protein